MRKFIDLPVYLIVRVFIFFVSFLSRRQLLMLGRFIGRALFYSRVLFYGKVLDNLDLCFGSEKTKNELKAMSKLFFEHFGMNLMELFYDRPLTGEFVDSSIEFEGLELLDQARAEGRGVLVLTGHYGSWELLGHLMGYKGYPLDSIYKPFDNKFLDSLMKKKRAVNGGDPIEMENAYVVIMKSLRAGKMVCMLFDQRARAGEGITIDFMGKPARTNKALAIIAMRTKSPVIPMFISRTREGHKVTFSPRVDVTAGGREEVVVNSIKFSKILEDKIKEKPQEWMWFLPRWKSGQYRK